jgi:DNA-binding response OmpR family regulator
VPRVLVVDDEPDLLELLSYNLRKEGLQVSTALDGEQALRMLQSQGFDLLVLDLMLPGLNGLELLRLLRQRAGTQHLPVVLLTAKGEEVDKVLGLELGADDYVTKPFSIRELLARIRAVLRRARAASQPQGIRIGQLLIDTQACKVLKGGRALELSAKEFKLLSYMARHPGRVFSREQLLDAVWTGEAVEPRTVDVHIRRLRAQVEDDPSSPRYIITRRGLGYCLQSPEEET